MIIDTDAVGGQDVMYTLFEAVAEEADADIRELPPLYETIDPEALAAFLRGSNGTDARPERSVAFTYCGYRVAVDSSGQIELGARS